MPSGRPAITCTATAKSTGERCQKSPIMGGSVCKYHGGGAPQVKRAAALRLSELVAPALVVLGRILADPMSSDTSKLRAIENVLDRAGHPRTSTLDVESGKRELIERFESDPALQQILDEWDNK